MAAAYTEYEEGLNMNTKINRRINDDALLGGAGLTVEQQNPETPVTGASGQSVAPVLTGASVKVTAPTDIQSLMEKLRQETNDRREDVVRGKMQSALAAAVEAIRASDAEASKTIDAIEQNAEKMSAVQQELSEIDKALKNLPSEEVLALRIKELEAAIEREKKTPEELEKEYEQKTDSKAQSQALAELEKQLKEATDQLAEVKELVTRRTAAAGTLASLQAGNKSLYESLDVRVKNSITAALSSVAPEQLDDLQLDGEEDARKGRVQIDGAEALAMLLTGARLKDVIAEKIERNV